MWGRRKDDNVGIGALERLFLPVWHSPAKLKQINTCRAVWVLVRLRPRNTLFQSTAQRWLTAVTSLSLSTRWTVSTTLTLSKETLSDLVGKPKQYIQHCVIDYLNTQGALDFNPPSTRYNGAIGTNWSKCNTFEDVGWLNSSVENSVVE